MQKNTSISLGKHFDDFIESRISSGRYSSRSEVIRTALRILEEEEIKLQNLRVSLNQGEESGFISDFRINSYLKHLNEKN